MIQRNYALPACMALAVAACQQPDDSNIAIDNGPNVAVSNLESVPPSESGSAPASGVTPLNEADNAN